MYSVCILYLQALQHMTLSAFVKRYILTTCIASGPNALKNEKAENCQRWTSIPSCSWGRDSTVFVLGMLPAGASRSLWSSVIEIGMLSAPVFFKYLLLPANTNSLVPFSIHRGDFFAGEGYTLKGAGFNLGSEFCLRWRLFSSELFQSCGKYFSDGGGRLNSVQGLLHPQHVTSHQRV